MHVCLVHRDLHQLTRGGICTVYKALAARLAERGHRVTLLTQTTPHERDLADADLPGFYRAADWLLSTSRWEGFGLAIAEAMACGTPSLLPADLGTAPELLSGGGGLAYRDDDHLIDLVSTHRPGPACLPEHLHWDANGAATTEIYRRLVHPATAV